MIIELREKLRDAERLMAEAISLIRGGRETLAPAVLLRARELYSSLLAGDIPDPIRIVARDRRIHSRIDRILRALRQEGEVEYFDVLDGEGRPAGRREASTLAHLRGTPHSSVEVIFFNPAREVLLQLRSPILAVFPSKWTFAATGHVASGYSSRAAAREEIIEEVRARRAARKEPEEEWIAFEPRDENLRQLGEENEFAAVLFVAEFIYWDEDERRLLESETSQRLKAERSTDFSRVFIDVDEPAQTLSLFALDGRACAEGEKVANEVDSATKIPCGMITDNVERKSLYLYRAESDEIARIEEIITQKRTAVKKSDDSFTLDFAWKDFDEIIREFQRTPERFTDGFVPFLSDPAIVERIRTAMK